MGHTADVAIEAEAVTLPELLASAAHGLREVMTGRSAVPHGLPDRSVSFRVEAPDPPSLAVAFLSELIWLMESEGVLWVGGGLEVTCGDDGCVAVARGNGVDHDPARHGRGVEVKAVTYSDLVAKRGDDGRWHLRVILDL